VRGAAMEAKSDQRCGVVDPKEMTSMSRVQRPSMLVPPHTKIESTSAAHENPMSARRMFGPLVVSPVAKSRTSTLGTADKPRAPGRSSKRSLVALYGHGTS
jgi:hypothetical protein